MSNIVRTGSAPLGGGGIELTEEHETGFLFNGEPVYEKFISTNFKTASSNTMPAYHTIPDLKDVLELSCVGYNGAGWTDVSFPISAQGSNAMAAYNQIFAVPSNGAISYKFSHSGFNGQPLIFKILYTKNS